MNLPVLASPQEVVAAADDPKVAIITLTHHATQCLRQATEVEVGELTDTAVKAEAFRAYSVQKKLGKDAEQAACELRVWAERRLGELIPEVHPHGTNQWTFPEERSSPSLACPGSSRTSSSSSLAFPRKCLSARSRC